MIRTYSWLIGDREIYYYLLGTTTTITITYIHYFLYIRIGTYHYTYTTNTTYILYAKIMQKNE